MRMRKQNRNAVCFFFLILGFHSIRLFSSSKDQVLGPISLVLSCKCRKLLTLLYIVGKLSNCMLYNYMFSSLEMDPGNSFQLKKKSKPTNQKKKMYSAIFFSSVYILCMNESLLFTFFSAFLYCIQILESEALKQDHQEPKYFLLLSVSPAQEKHVLFPLHSLPFPLPWPSTDYLHVANLLHSFACFRMIY